MASGFRAFSSPGAWRVYLPTGFDFREKSWLECGRLELRWRPASNLSIFLSVEGEVDSFFFCILLFFFLDNNAKQNIYRYNGAECFKTHLSDRRTRLSHTENTHNTATKQRHSH